MKESAKKNTVNRELRNTGFERGLSSKEKSDQILGKTSWWKQWARTERKTVEVSVSYFYVLGNGRNIVDPELNN